MTIPSEINTTPLTAKEIGRGTLRFFGSMKLAVALIVILAAVLAWATFQEAARGREYAQWYVYHSRWFIGLLALLGVNILAATLVRFPWKKRFGFVVTHAGLLVLLSRRAANLPLRDRRPCLLPGRRDEQPDRAHGPQSIRGPLAGIAGTASARPGGVRLSARPGRLAGGQGVGHGRDQRGEAPRAQILRPCADHRELGGGPVATGRAGMRFAFAGPDDAMVAEDWLAAEEYGAESYFGPTKFELQRASDASMLDDFLAPPEKMDPQGVLSIHYGKTTLRVDVSKNVGKKVAAGEHGPTVEIAAYLPNARPGNSGRFLSAGEDPRTPCWNCGSICPAARSRSARSPLRGCRS